MPRYTIPRCAHCNSGAMPRFAVPRVAHCASGELARARDKASLAWLPAVPGPSLHPRAEGKRMLAIIAAVLFGIGFVCAAFIHGSVPAVIDPGFMWLGLCLLALHLVWPLGPWHRPPP